MEMTNKLSAKALADYQMVQRAMAGSQKAYGKLFQKYRNLMFFMILKMVGDRMIAEDLMFESFEKAFAALKCYSPRFAFSTWLFKIASNNAIDYLRRQKLKNASLVFDDAGPEEQGYIASLPSDALSPQEELVRKQRVEFIRRQVAELKGRYRRLVELRYFEERSYEEIACLMGLPLGTVKAQLFRARKMLQAAFENTEWVRER